LYQQLQRRQRRQQKQLGAYCLLQQLEVPHAVQQQRLHLK
jgi:hypothetical protein